MINVNVEGIEGVVSVKDGEHPVNEQTLVTFKNGYTASIISGPRTYGTELAVLKDGEITYDTPITNDVLGHLTDTSLRIALEDIAALLAPVHFEYYDLHTEANKVVNDFGSSHITEQCVYVRGEEKYDDAGRYTPGELVPVCIVGQILVRKGIAPTTLWDMSVLSYEREAFKAKGITFTDKAYFFLDTLQAIQDSGETWATSLRLAVKVTGRREWRDGTQELTRI